MLFYEYFNISIGKNKILIFEPNTYHHKCTPDFTKYFMDFWCMHFSGIDCFCVFQEIEKVRLLIFKGIKEIEVNTKNLSFIIKKYDFVLLQTNEINKKKLHINLWILNISNSILYFMIIGLLILDTWII